MQFPIRLLWLPDRVRVDLVLKERYEIASRARFERPVRGGCFYASINRLPLGPGILSPNSFAVSIHSSIASFTFLNAFSDVLP